MDAPPAKNQSAEESGLTAVDYVVLGMGLRDWTDNASVCTYHCIAAATTASRKAFLAIMQSYHHELWNLASLNITCLKNDDSVEVVVWLVVEEVGETTLAERGNAKQSRLSTCS